MRKVIFTLAYNNPVVVEQAYMRLKQTQKLDEYEYYIVDPGFPIPNKHDNFVALADMCKRWKIELLRPSRNRGVAGNWMWTIYELGLVDRDVLIGMDPDSVPMDSGWCDAIVNVIDNGSKSIAYCGLRRTSPPQLSTEVDESKIGYTMGQLGGIGVRFYSQPVSWPMGGFSARFAREVGIHQPRPHYGFIEIETIRRMRGTEWDWCILDSYRDSTSERGHRLFQDWKVKQARGETTLDFAEYIRES